MMLSLLIQKSILQAHPDVFSGTGCQSGHSCKPGVTHFLILLCASMVLHIKILKTFQRSDVYAVVLKYMQPIWAFENAAWRKKSRYFRFFKIGLYDFGGVFEQEVILSQDTCLNIKRVSLIWLSLSSTLEF
jgi:hypothetical protein